MSESLVAVPSHDPDRFDLRSILDEELIRLPATYRAALVLCYLEGHTHEQAARQLGWPVGTVRSRLARGRERMRRRLLRRGLAPSAGLSTAMLTVEVSSATVPAGLVEATVRVAMLTAEGKAATAGAVLASVAALSETVIRTMLMIKLRMTASALLILGVVAVGASGLVRQHPEAGKQRDAQHVEGEGLVGTTDRARSDTENIQGTWRAISAQDGGRRSPEDEIKGLELVITSDTLTIGVGDKIQGKSPYKLDPSKEPKWIDLTEKAGRPAPGIYDLQGDDLKLCYNESANGRPTKFASEPNSPNDVLLILKRERPEARQINRPAGESNAHRKSVIMAKESFGERHWSAAENLEVRYYNAAEGYWMLYAKEYERLDDGKRIRLRPFALIWLERSGRGYKTVTCEEAVIDLDKPIGLTKDSGGSLPDIVSARMFGDVRLRDDKGTPRNTDDDLVIDPVSRAEYDGKSLRIRSDSQVRVRVGNSTLSARDLRIELPQPGARAGKK